MHTQPMTYSDRAGPNRQLGPYVFLLKMIHLKNIGAFYIVFLGNLSTKDVT